VWGRRVRELQVAGGGEGVGGGGMSEVALCLLVRAGWVRGALLSSLAGGPGPGHGLCGTTCTSVQLSVQGACGREWPCRVEGRGMAAQRLYPFVLLAY
jgi:hypothetical protein